jgi:hypothetical protein
MKTMPILPDLKKKKKNQPDASVILATQEAEIRRIMVCKTNLEKTHLKNRTDGVA